MPANKTKPTTASVSAYITERATPQQRADCRVLMALLKRVTGKSPRMWGPSIVGYGKYQYTYASGHSGEAPLSGFAIRGRDLVVYLMCEGEAQATLLPRLGRHRMTTSCLYLKQLADIDLAVLERLITDSVRGLERRYPPSARR